MKDFKLPSLIAGLALILALVFFNDCSEKKVSSYEKIRVHADAFKVINTHEHQHSADEIPASRFRFYQLLAAAYLDGDVISAGVKAFDMKLLDSASLDDLWDMYGTALSFTRNTSYYSHFVKGFRKLYDFDDLFFTKENIARLSSEIENNYSNYGSWFEEAFKKAGFEVMFLDQYWKPFNTEVDKRYYALVFHINPLISESYRKPDRGTEPRSFYKRASDDGFTINNLDDYLAFCDHLFRKNIDNNAVCVKNSQAYSRTLY